MTPVALIFPPITSLADAQSLVRRCWGGWYLLAPVVAVTLIVLIGTIVVATRDMMIPTNLTRLMFALVATTLLALVCQRLFARAALWAAWLLLFGASLHLILGVAIIFAFGEGPLDRLLWFWPALSLLAVLSLVNAVRGCRGVRYYNRPEVIAASFLGDDGPSPAS